MAIILSTFLNLHSHIEIGTAVCDCVQLAQSLRAFLTKERAPIAASVSIMGGVGDSTRSIRWEKVPRSCCPSTVQLCTSR